MFTNTISYTLKNKRVSKGKRSNSKGVNRYFTLPLQMQMRRSSGSDSCRVKDVMKDKYRLTDKFIAVMAVLFPSIADDEAKKYYERFVNLRRCVIYFSWRGIF